MCWAIKSKSTPHQVWSHLGCRPEHAPMNSPLPEGKVLEVSRASVFRTTSKIYVKISPEHTLYCSVLSVVSLNSEVLDGLSAL